jgi:hypothetical protein
MRAKRLNIGVEAYEAFRGEFAVLWHGEVPNQADLVINGPAARRLALGLAALRVQPLLSSGL